MAEPARQYPAAPGEIRLAPAPDAGANVSADIVELIMADHRRIGRLCSAVYDIARHGGQSGPDWMLGHVWQRLADVLVAHIQAEEETCYSSVSGADPRATGQIRASIADHDAIREIIGEVSLLPVGSAPWWHAVRTVMAVSAEHHEREERDVLPGYVLGLGMSRRKELGRQWCAFMAAWKRDVTLRPVPRLPLAVDGTLVDTNYLHAIWDVEACQKAGVPCIGLLSGGISRDELTSAGAAEVYPGPADLLAALGDSLLARTAG